MYIFDTNEYNNNQLNNNFFACGLKKFKFRAAIHHHLKYSHTATAIYFHWVKHISCLITIFQLFFSLFFDSKQQTEIIVKTTIFGIFGYQNEKIKVPIVFVARECDHFILNGPSINFRLFTHILYHRCCCFVNVFLKNKLSEWKTNKFILFFTQPEKSIIFSFNEKKSKMKTFTIITWTSINFDCSVNIHK